MSKDHRWEIGKVDYNGSGRRNCMVALTWSLDNGRFSMCGEVWNPRRSDVYSCGQNIDEIARLFPGNARVQRMAEVWRRWHLNDMKAGSPAQMAWLEANASDWAAYQAGKRGIGYGGNHYVWACEALSAAGLNPDTGYLHNGSPYRYGSAWLREDLPAEVVAEVEGWSVPL